MNGTATHHHLLAFELCGPSESSADGLVSLRSFPALLISEYHSGSRGPRVLDNAGN